jgi:hypothetical protein
MIRIAVAGLALATLSAVAQARPDHDASIDAAAAKIVAARIGELRGGFAFGAAPKMTHALDTAPTGTVEMPRGSGLKPAIEVRFAVPPVR